MGHAAAQAQRVAGLTDISQITLYSYGGTVNSTPESIIDFAKVTPKVIILAAYIEVTYWDGVTNNYYGYLEYSTNGTSWIPFYTLDWLNDFTQVGRILTLDVLQEGIDSSHNRAACRTARSSGGVRQTTGTWVGTNAANPYLFLRYRHIATGIDQTPTVQFSVKIAYRAFPGESGTITQT